MAASASEKYLDVESLCVLGQFPTCITDAITRAAGEQLLLHTVLFVNKKIILKLKFNIFFFELSKWGRSPTERSVFNFFFSISEIFFGQIIQYFSYQVSERQIYFYSRKAGSFLSLQKYTLV